MKKNILLLFLFTGLLSCGDDYLKTAPTSSVSEDDIFSTITGASTVIEGMHRYMYSYYDNHSTFGQKSVDLIADILGEDFFPNESGYGWFVPWYQYLVHRNIQGKDLEFVWSFYYDLIANANIVLNKLDDIPVFDDQIPLKENLRAQALTYRAFAHYQLVQLFAKRYNFENGGDNSHMGVPVVLTPGPEGLPRSTVAEVYSQIKKDLNDAISLFNGSANGVSRSNKSQININVAQAIAARVALTTGDWAGAAGHAREARQGTALETNYLYGWSKVSTEWIWGAILIAEQQTSYASFFSHIDPLFGGYASFGNHKLGSITLIDFMNDTDQRKEAFNSHHFGENVFEKSFAKKENVGWKFTGFGEWTNDYLYIKAGEMYLIEAEALARQAGKDSEAIKVLTELVTNRDPKYVAPALTGDALIEHILLQRRCDLWGEGQRFFDIKRVNKGFSRLNNGHNNALWNDAPEFGANAKQLIFLIPKQEMDSNPDMVQNEL